MNIDITPHHPMPGPSADRAGGGGMGWGGVIRKFILISILILILISLLIDIVESNQCT